MINFKPTVTPVEAFEPRKRYNYKPADDHPGLITLADFIGIATELVEPFNGEVMSSVLAAQINGEFERLFIQIEMARKKVLLFEDVYLTGIRMKHQFENPQKGIEQKIVIDQITTKAPFPVNNPGGQSAFIGRFSGQDIFIGYQGLLPSTIVFGTANRPDHFTTFNPNLMRMPSVDLPDYKLYRYAYERYRMAQGFFALNNNR